MSPHSVGEQVRLSPELQGLCASAHDGSGPRPPTEAAYPARELCAAHRRNGPCCWKGSRLVLAELSSSLARPRTLPVGFIQSCLPIKAPKPPTGAAWLHEIKHDG